MPKALIGSLSLAILVFAIAAVVSFQRYAEQLVDRTTKSLFDLNELKADALLDWSRERFGDANLVQGRAVVQQSLARPDDQVQYAKLLQYMGELVRSHAYRQVALFDASGHPLAASSDAPLHSCTPGHVREALDTRAVVFADLHRPSPTETLDMSFWVPIETLRDDGTQVWGVVELSVDPEGFLRRVVGRHSTWGFLATTVLLQEAGDDLLVFGLGKEGMRIPRELLPVTTKTWETTSALNGRPMRLVVTKIPGTSWRVATGIEESELNGPISTAAWTFGLLAALASFLAFLVVGMAWRQRGLELARSSLVEEQEHQRELERAEARSRAMLDAIPDMMFRIDHKGVFLDYRANVSDLYSGDQKIIGRNCDELLPPSLCAQLRENLAASLSARSLRRFEYELQRQDGQTRYYEARMTPSGDNEVIAVIRDFTEQRAAQARLINSEARFKGIFEGSTDGIILLDFDHRTLKMVNPSFSHMLGYEPEELVGKPISDLQAGSLSEVLTTRQGSAGVTQGPEIRVLRKDGSEVFVDLRTSLIELDGVTHLAGFFRDTTDRRAAEAALQASEAQLAEALQMAQAGHWSYDVLADRFTFNDHFYRIFRTTAAEVGGYQMSAAEYARRFVHPDDAWLVAAEVQSAVMGKEPKIFRRVEHRILYADGQVGFVSVQIFGDRVDGRVLRTYGLNQDVTERRKAETERAQLATAVDQAADIILITDLGGTILYANPAFERITGFAPAPSSELPEALGLDLQSEPLRSMLDALLRGELWRGRLECRRKDGAHLDLESVVSPVRDARGVMTHYVFGAQDVTLRVKMEHQIRDSQRMEGIGRLAGGIAHDFNNILAATLVQVALMNDSPDLPEPLKEGLKDLEHNAKRATALTRQLLVFSRQSLVQKTAVDFNEVVTNLLRMLARLLGEDIAVELRLADGLPLTEADAGMVEQVILNLAVNARDAMPRGGHLIFGTQVVEISPEEVAMHPRRKAGRFIRLSVEDTGTGMDPTIIERIFDPFFTTKEAGKGTGLGLSTVYGIVEQHGGFIEVDSSLGQGSRFRAYFPCTSITNKPLPASKVERTTGNETILLVEDERSVRRAIAEVLRIAGYEVIEAVDGPEALRIWEKRGFEIQLLYTDVVMPGGLSGLELAARLVATRPDLKVVVSSGYSADLIEVPEELRALKYAYVPKPCDPTELMAIVRTCLDTPAPSTT